VKRESGGSCTLGVGGVHWGRRTIGGREVDERSLLMRKKELKEEKRGEIYRA